MTARRQPSTTSLSKFARAPSPGTENRSLDFCNSFWGIADGGVEVLFARMRGAMRTVDELKSFWKERAAIEEEYAKRLSKLAKQTLGRDEIGELRNSLDTLRLETDNQANFHLELTRQIRGLLEGPTSAFYAKEQQHKKLFQASIEKDFKAKQTQESYVNRAREKYESDCLKINSYTAQSTLVQGKDLEKIQLKLERAQQTVQANERDFANFAKALAVTAAKWEQDWKAFCDSCQDMEEERMNFMKDTMWAFANAVSTVCVADDESCEKLRLALEQMEPEQDMENFVRDYGTGNLIPDPPSFVNYTTPDAVPSSSSRPTTHAAQFSRMTQRQFRSQPMAQEEEETSVNTAGVGAGGRRGDPQPDAPLHRSQTRTSTRAGSTPAPMQAPQQVQPQINGGGTVDGHQLAYINVAQPQPSINRRPTSSGQPVNYNRGAQQDPHADTIDPTADTYIQVGSNVYMVDLSKDPQQPQHQGGTSSSRMNSMPAQVNAGVGASGSKFDPLAQQMEDLKRAASSAGTSGWRASQQGSTSRKGTELGAGPSSLALPGGSKPAAGGSGPPQQPRDYRNSAEVVVGAHPSVSRPSSPNPPTAKFMIPRSPSPSNTNTLEQRVLQDYHQSLPGEAKSPARSRQGSYSGAPPAGHPAHPSHGQTQSQGQINLNSVNNGLAKPNSQTGHVGIGAHGRSASPQPVSRSASPAPGGYMGPPGGGQGGGVNGGSMQRATSPGVGVALDASGRVIQGGDVGDPYGRGIQQQQHHQHHQQRGPSPQPQQAYPQPQQQAARQGYGAPPQQQQQQGGAPGYGAPQYQTPVVAPAQQGYGTVPQYQQPPYAQSQQPQQQPHGAYPAQPTYGGGGYAPGQGQVQQPLQQQLTYIQGGQVTRTPSPQPVVQQQAVAPPPTGQTTEDGRGILFYVKALYDYTATIEEEFDFQAGDIIAVTATPEDGWWSGELLDEARRQPGRHVFPSNFVCLF